MKRFSTRVAVLLALVIGLVPGCSESDPSARSAKSRRNVAPADADSVPSDSDLDTIAKALFTLRPQVEVPVGLIEDAAGARRSFASLWRLPLAEMGWNVEDVTVIERDAGFALANIKISWEGTATNTTGLDPSGDMAGVVEMLSGLGSFGFVRVAFVYVDGTLMMSAYSACSIASESASYLGDRVQKCTETAPVPIGYHADPTVKYDVPAGTASTLVAGSAVWADLSEDADLTATGPFSVANLADPSSESTREFAHPVQLFRSVQGEALALQYLFDRESSAPTSVLVSALSSPDRTFAVSPLGRLVGIDFERRMSFHVEDEISPGSTAPVIRLVERSFGDGGEVRAWRLGEDPNRFMRGGPGIQVPAVSRTGAVAADFIRNVLITVSFDDGGGVVSEPVTTPIPDEANGAICVIGDTFVLSVSPSGSALRSTLESYSTVDGSLQATRQFDGELTAACGANQLWLMVIPSGMSQDGSAPLDGSDLGFEISGGGQQVSLHEVGVSDLADREVKRTLFPSGASPYFSLDGDTPYLTSGGSVITFRD